MSALTPWPLKLPDMTAAYAAPVFSIANASRVYRVIARYSPRGPNVNPLVVFEASSGVSEGLSADTSRQVDDLLIWFGPATEGRLAFWDDDRGIHYSLSARGANKTEHELDTLLADVARTVADSPSR